MKKINYHTHTELCRHAGGNIADYIGKAQTQKLDALGFSEHAPFPDGRFGLRMLYSELPDYLEEIRLQKHLLKASSLQIYAGLEIEYCPDMNSYYESLLQSGKLDYLLLGQHFYTLNGQEPVNIYFIEQHKDTSPYVDYALSLKAAMETGYFRVLAHPDVIFINKLLWDENCDRACDIIIEAALRANTILEFNANGLRRGKSEYPEGQRYPYPHPGFWSRVSGSGLPVIVSSDCHNPDVLWDCCMDEAYRLAHEWNLSLTDDIGL